MTIKNVEQTTAIKPDVRLSSKMVNVEFTHVSEQDAAQQKVSVIAYRLNRTCIFPFALGTYKNYVSHSLIIIKLMSCLPVFTKI